MKLYLVSLGAGLLVGFLYSLLGVRSPAPPLVALVGLLGILVGEQILPMGRHLFDASAADAITVRRGVVHHVLGELPAAHNAPQKAEIPAE